LLFTVQNGDVSLHAAPEKNEYCYVKFDIEIIRKRLLGEFNFGLYQSNAMRSFLDTSLRLIDFSFYIYAFLYKPEGRELDFRLGHWDFFIDLFLPG
jgi:hypothetical protein